MMTAVLELRPLSMSMTWTEVLESKAPVGSSAKMMEGWPTMARAMATRCCWPPLNSEGFFW